MNKIVMINGFKVAGQGLIFMTVLIGCVFAAQAEQRCVQNWACVDRQHNDDGSIDFYLRNHRPYTITMTLEVRPRNMSSLQDDTITRTIGGHNRIWVSRYLVQNRRRDNDADFSFQWAVGSQEVTHDDDYLYRLPFATDDGHYVVQGFNGGYSHRGLSRYGVDFAMPDGTRLHAAREGTVVDVEYGNSRGGASRKYAAYANFVVIEHSDGSTGEYYHLQHHGVFVRPGDKVSRGQLIGLSGSTGFTSLPHLHFAVYKALPMGDTQSLAFKFISADGIVSNPGYGKRYRVALSD